MSLLHKSDEDITLLVVTRIGPDDPVRLDFYINGQRTQTVNMTPQEATRHAADVLYLATRW